MNKAQSKALLDSNIDSIRFSIYSVLQDKHRNVTKNSISVDTIRENIKYLRKERDRLNKDKPFIFVKAFDTYSEENEIFKDMYKGIADRIDFEKVHDATKYKKK
jgi:hypothetical protein